MPTLVITTLAFLTKPRSTEKLRMMLHIIPTLIGHEQHSGHVLHGNPGILITGDDMAKDDNGSTKSVGENELKTFISKTIAHKIYYLRELW